VALSLHGPGHAIGHSVRWNHKDTTMTQIPSEGTRLRLVAMVDDPDPLPPGSLGTVRGAQTFPGWAQIWVHWDNGRTLSLAVPPDQYEIVAADQGAA